MGLDRVVGGTHGIQLETHGFKWCQGGTHGIEGRLKETHGIERGLFRFGWKPDIPLNMIAQCCW